MRQAPPACVRAKGPRLHPGRLVGAPPLSEEVERLVILTYELGPLRNRGVHVGGGVDLELARTFLSTLGDEGQRGLFARLAAGVARLRS